MTPLLRCLALIVIVATLTQISLPTHASSLIGGQPVKPLSWSYGENGYNISRPEGPRSYYVYVPKSYVNSSSSAAMSLVIALHGLTDHAQNFAVWAGWQEAAETRGFILMYPQGFVGPRGTAWNAGTCCITTTDDVAFIGDALSPIFSTFNLREESIHVAGFSNGGFMSERLACEWPFLASAASVSGNTILWPGMAAGMRTCTDLYDGTLSMLHIHGDADPVVPWTGNSTLGFPDIPSDMAGWVLRNDCTDPPVQTLNEMTFTNQVWQNCGGDSHRSIELVRNAGGGHLWPLDPAIGIVATEYICDFFDAHTKGGL